ncbi:BMP family ABC transporter substrate-binding protein [Desulfovibrio sp. UCD-KL4C]|uniref:BMP family lipoprotein n=1 Tax=Desulfovibrio sp. UCD-KL4C TaxID=2578120 RepID=UPI0025BC8608|nr:BMP family ABC transporter substrate-binding protein [Desulfovibrio sp. UCD-KL4C]
MKKILSEFFILLLLSTTAWADHTVLGLVIGPAGLGNLSFNDMAYSGVRKAQQEFNFKLIILEPEEMGKSELSALKDLAEKSDIVVFLGSQFQRLLPKLARLYTNKKFIMIGVPVESAPNICAAAFTQYEGSFLAGAFAAYMTKTNTIGFIGGVNVPPIQQFEKGFYDGAKYVNPRIKVLVDYVSPAGDFSGFNDVKKGYSLAINQYKNNADIIFSAAGITGNGVIKAAINTGKYVIGVDSNQDYVAKGTILTSMIKRMDVAAYQEIKRVMEGNFSSNTTYYGLKNQGVKLSDMKYTRDKISEDIIRKIDIIKNKIINGEI